MAARHETGRALQLQECKAAEDARLKATYWYSKVATLHRRDTQPATLNNLLRTIREISAGSQCTGTSLVIDSAVSTPESVQVSPTLPLRCNKTTRCAIVFWETSRSRPMCLLGHGRKVNCQKA